MSGAIIRLQASDRVAISATSTDRDEVPATRDSAACARFASSGLEQTPTLERRQEASGDLRVDLVEFDDDIRDELEADPSTALKRVGLPAAKLPISERTRFGLVIEKAGCRISPRIVSKTSVAGCIA